MDIRNGFLKFYSLKQYQGTKNTKEKLISALEQENSTIVDRY